MGLYGDLLTKGFSIVYDLRIKAWFGRLLHWNDSLGRNEIEAGLLPVWKTHSKRDSLSLKGCVEGD